MVGCGGVIIITLSINEQHNVCSGLVCCLRWFVGCHGDWCEGSAVLVLCAGAAGLPKWIMNLQRNIINVFLMGFRGHH